VPEHTQPEQTMIDASHPPYSIDEVDGSVNRQQLAMENLPTHPSIG
jgi:hypothetical protein